MSVIRLAGWNIDFSDTCSSFEEIGQSMTEPLPEGTELTVATVYAGFLKGIQAFFADYYDGREETEKDV